MKIFTNFLYSGFFATVFGVLLAYLGNYVVQHKLHRRSVRMDAFRDMLVAYSLVVSKYWVGPHKTDADRKGLEAEIKVRQMILLGEFQSLSTKYSSVQKIRYEHQDQIRTDLIRTATGGAFESSEWQPDPNRAQAVVRSVRRVLSKLP